jgi:WhiB family redox-sensing transcriptional regulator
MTLPQLLSASSRFKNPTACRDVDTNIFFPVDDHRMQQQQIDDAKAICRECPARMECLEFAIATNQKFGIWGGTTDKERRRIKRQRRAVRDHERSAS